MGERRAGDAGENAKKIAINRESVYKTTETQGVFVVLVFFRCYTNKNCFLGQ